MAWRRRVSRWFLSQNLVLNTGSFGLQSLMLSVFVCPGAASCRRQDTQRFLGGLDLSASEGPDRAMVLRSAETLKLRFEKKAQHKTQVAHQRNNESPNIQFYYQFSFRDEAMHTRMHIKAGRENNESLLLCFILNNTTDMSLHTHTRTYEHDIYMLAGKEGW